MYHLSNQLIRDSIVAIIPACHAGDPSSILGRGDFLFFTFKNFISYFILHNHGFSLLYKMHFN